MEQNKPLHEKQPVRRRFSGCLRERADMPVRGAVGGRYSEQSGPGGRRARSSGGVRITVGGIKTGKKAMS